MQKRVGGPVLACVFGCGGFFVLGVRLCPVGPQWSQQTGRCVASAGVGAQSTHQRFVINCIVAPCTTRAVGESLFGQVCIVFKTAVN
jgi:hypothetical protein